MPKMSDFIHAVGITYLVEELKNVVLGFGRDFAKDRIAKRFEEHREEYYQWLWSSFKDREPDAYQRLWHQQRRRHDWEASGGVFNRASEDEMNKALGDLYVSIMTSKVSDLAAGVTEGSPKSIREALSILDRGYDAEELCFTVFQELAAMDDHDFEVALDALTEDGPIRYLLMVSDATRNFFAQQWPRFDAADRALATRIRDRRARIGFWRGPF